MPAVGSWHIDIAPWMNFTQNVGTWSLANNVSAITGGNLVAGTAAQNDQVSWDVYLTAGTWTLTSIHRTTASSAIGTFALDATTLGTLDAYSAGNVDNVVGSIAGFSVAADGKYTLSITLATKNASSSGFNWRQQWLTLNRTA